MIRTFSLSLCNTKFKKLLIYIYGVLPAIRHFPSKNYCSVPEVTYFLSKDLNFFFGTAIVRKIAHEIT